MKGKGLLGIVLASVGYFGSGKASAQSIDPAANLPEGLVERAILNDSSSSWGNSLEVSGNSVKLKKGEVEVDSGLYPEFNRTYNYNQLRFYLLDRDNSEKKSKRNPKDRKGNVVEGIYLQSKGPVKLKLPNWMIDGPHAVYLLTEPGVVSGIPRNQVGRIDEYYKLPESSGTLSFGDIPDPDEIARKKKGKKTPSPILPGEDPEKGEEKQVAAEEELAGTEKGSDERPAPFGRDKGANAASTSVGTEQAFLTGGSMLGNEKKEDNGENKFLASMRAGLILGHLNAAFTGSDTRTEGTGGLVGASVGYNFSDNLSAGVFSEYSRRGLQVGDIGRAVSLGTGSDLISFAVGPTARLNLAEGKRGEAHAALAPGYLAHRLHYEYDVTDFEEKGDGLVLNADVFLPRLFYNNEKLNLGLRNRTSFEIVDIIQKELNSDVSAEYGLKKRGANELAMTVGVPKYGLGASLGWEYDSVYTLAWKDDLSVESLTRIQNQAENGAADLTSVTKGNYSGHQIPLSVKFTPTNWNGFYFTGRGVIPAAGNVQRSSLGAGLGHNKYGSLTFTYEKSEADVGNQELSNAGYFLTLDLKTEGNNLLPQRREIYPDLR